MSSLIVVPCHPPHYEWLVRFLDSCTGDVPILIVATNGPEYHWFSEQLSQHPKINSLRLTLISCTDVAAGYGFTIDFANVGRGMINLKKFIALYHARDGFEDFLCVDADTEMVGTTDAALEAAAKNYDYRYFAGYTDNERCVYINRGCLRLFTNEQKAVIRQATRNCHLYTWFFDPPYYRREDLTAFFDFMAENHGSVDDFLQMLSWPTFDHILYVYFLLLTRGAQIVDYGLERIPELLTAEDARMLEARFGVHPVWAAKGVYTGQPVQMLCHMDRPDWSE